MTWEELVVFSNPHRRRTHKNRLLTNDDCKAIQKLVEYNYPRPVIPTPDEFADVRAPKILEFWYDEVSPFPYGNRVRIATRILRGGKIRQWRGLYPGKRYNGYKPFKAWRGIDGVCIEFVDPKAQLETIPVLHCRRDCLIRGGNQCAAFGSYSQIELSPFLPIWSDRCSAKSAKDCPMRIAAINGIFPKPTPEDPYVKQFRRWCEIRKGYAVKRG